MLVNKETQNIRRGCKASLKTTRFGRYKKEQGRIWRKEFEQKQREREAGERRRLDEEQRRRAAEGEKRLEQEQREREQKEKEA